VVLARLDPVYVWLHHSIGGEGPELAATRFLLAAAILLVPCTLMGFTLPVLSRAVINREGVAGRGAGALYAANTLGAVAGCTLAGFVWIPAFGLFSTSVAAALLNLGVAAAAIAIGGRFEPAPAAIVAGATPRAIGLAATVFAVSGFAAMGYEVLWTRALQHYMHNSTYAYTAMLAVFLAGIGLGSAASARVADRLRSPHLALAALQLLIALSVIVGLRVFMSFERLVPAASQALGGLDSWPRVLTLIFTEAALTMLATTLLLGAMFPLVVRLAVDRPDAVGRSVGIVYVANTLGCIAGSLVTGFIALPALGVRGGFLALMHLNLGIAAVLALREQRTPQAVAIAAAAAVSSVLAITLLPATLFPDGFAARFGRILFYREEVTDTVMVTETENGSRMIRYADGRGTAGTPTVREDRMYAHIPLLLHPAAQRVLQIGFGVGNTLSSTLVHPVTRVDCVELSPGVVDAAPFFRETNRDALSDPRVRLVITDGRNFVLTSSDRYDVIRMDPPELHTAGVVNLYTREFFEQVRLHLAPGGVFSAWINAVMTPIDDIRLLLRTLLDVFPHVSVWTGPAQYSWVMNASVEPLDPDLQRLTRAFTDATLRADLATIGIATPFDFLDHFVISGAELRELAGEGPLVTDDHTRLDFSVPRSRDAYYGIANYNTDAWLVEFMVSAGRESAAAELFLEKIAELRAHRRPVLPYLRNVAAAGYGPAEVSARLPGVESAPP
jgi:spermidine synthase